MYDRALAIPFLDKQKRFFSCDYGDISSPTLSLSLIIEYIFDLH